MEQSKNEDRVQKDWETVDQFQDGGYYVKVNRNKVSRRFSLEMGGVAPSNGMLMRFVPVVWYATETGVEMDPAIDPAKLTGLLSRAHALVQDTLKNEGVRKRR